MRWIVRMWVLPVVLVWVPVGGVTGTVAHAESVAPPDPVDASTETPDAFVDPADAAFNEPDAHVVSPDAAVGGPDVGVSVPDAPGDGCECTTGGSESPATAMFAVALVGWAWRRIARVRRGSSARPIGR